MTDFVTVIQKSALIVIAILVVGFFEGMETSLLTLSSADLAKLKKTYPGKSAYLSLWENRPHYLLAATVVGTNAFFAAAGVLATSVSIDFSANVGASFAAGVAVPVIVMLLVLFFGEIIPKVYSRNNPEKVCAFGITPLARFAAPIYPVSVALVRTSEALLNALGWRTLKESAFMTKDELMSILEAPAAVSSEITDREKTMLSNVLTFGERRIREVMVPRSRIFAVNYDSGIEEIISGTVSSRFSRVPVYRDNLDNIAGIIYARDLAVTGDSPLYVIDDLIRPAYFVPESALVSGVLQEFRTGKHRIGIVVDEYGITKGLVTVEDIVEEITGEIYDEFDIGEKTVMKLPGGWFIKASESVTAVNSELKLGIPESGSYSTVGGWVLSIFGKIPSPGEQVRWKNFKVEVAESDGKRIISVKLLRHTP